MSPSGSASATTRYRPMTPMKARMRRSSRLSSGRTTAAATSRTAAASAMERAPRVHADPLPRHGERQDALLGDPPPAHQVHREVGADEHVPERLAHEVGAEERPQERKRVDPPREGLPLIPGDVLDHDVLRTDRALALGAG